MRTVHLPPPTTAVGGQPQVGFFEIAEQQKLAHLPRCVEPQHVLDVLAPRGIADRAADGEALVFPTNRRCLDAVALPRRPSHLVSIGAVRGGQRGIRGHRLTVP